MSEKLENTAKPTTILTGFLGAGKTTYLNHLLKSKPDTRFAIIENEYGEQSIDSELIIRAEDDIVELNNGCLCCTLNDNLYDILNTLHDRREEYDEVIIEATGVADPTGLAQPFITHPLIKKHFPLKAIICLVDAELVEDQLKETEEAINQITFSDVLLVNKIDLVSEKYITILEDRLQNLNPLAKLFKGHKNQFPEIEHFDNKHEKLEGLLQSHKKTESEELQFPVQKPHHHHHHHHTEAVKSHTFTFDRPFNFKRLHLQLSVYLSFQSKGLYRMKGLVWLENESQQYVLQAVGSRLDFEEKRAWNATEQRQSIIVFIGKDLQRAGLERMLNKCFSSTKMQLK